MTTTEVLSPSVGLFWFSQDYKEIVEVRGKKRLTDSDLLSNVRVDPIGLHAEHDMPRDIPRGRIYYEDKLFKIFVGEDCTNVPLDVIKTAFGLQHFHDDQFKIKHHYHWNTKI
jgi:hypothetical protein